MRAVSTVPSVCHAAPGLVDAPHIPLTPSIGSLRLSRDSLPTVQGHYEAKARRKAVAVTRMRGSPLRAGMVESWSTGGMAGFVSGSYAQVNGETATAIRNDAAVPPSGTNSSEREARRLACMTCRGCTLIESLLISPRRWFRCSTNGTCCGPRIIAA
jgi:hypothetical protein